MHESIIRFLLSDNTDFVSPLGDLQSFENEWMEVEVLGPKSPYLNSSEDCNPQGAMDIGNSNISENFTDESKVPAFLCNNIDPDYLNSDSDSECKFYII